MCTHQNSAGGGPGFDSKYEQLTSITIQTDPHQRTLGPVHIRLLVRSPEVPDTLSLARPADHGGADDESFFEKPTGACIGRPKLFSKDRFVLGTSVISAKNCRGAVESVLLQTLRPNGYLSTGRRSQVRRKPKYYY